MENKSPEINEIATALSKAQGVIIPASKDADNPFFKSKYADLASVWEVARKPLADNGLAVTQLPRAEGNIVTVMTILLHSSGQWLSSELTMVAKDAGPQAIGSCITYIRRYALSSIVGIASEIDDDANNATPAKGQVVTPQRMITLKDRVEGTGTAKFGSADKFKAWLVDNALKEDFATATDTELNHILNLIREVKKVDA